MVITAQAMQLSRIAPYQPPCTPRAGLVASKPGVPSKITRPGSASVGQKPRVAPIGGPARRPATTSRMNSSPVRDSISRASGRSSRVVATRRVMRPLLDRGPEVDKTPGSGSGHVAQRYLWCYAKRMADIAGQFGAVERVEMQVLGPAVDQVAAQLCRNGGGQQVLAPVTGGLVEGIDQPAGQGRAAAPGEFPHAGPVLDRQDAGDDGRVDPGPGAGIAEPKERLGLEEELRDRLGGAGVDLALEPVDIGGLVGGLGVFFGIGADADGELAGLCEGRNQLAAVSKALRVRGEAVRALGRVAAQGDEFRDTCGGELIGDLQRFGAAGIDASEMRGAIEAGGLVQRAHGLARQFTRGAARAIGDR